MISKETVSKALLRALYAMLGGAAAAFVVLPVDLTDPKRYFLSLFAGMIAGALLGLQKFIKGYLTYDK